MLTGTGLISTCNGHGKAYYAIGNPLTCLGMTLSRQNGRELAALTPPGINANCNCNDGSFA